MHDLTCLPFDHVDFQLCPLTGLKIHDTLNMHMCNYVFFYNIHFSNIII